MMKRTIIVMLLVAIIAIPVSVGSAAKPINEPPNWGFILDTKFHLDYIEYGFDDYWTGCLGISVYVFGIGRHNVSWEMRSDIYSHNGTQHHTDVLRDYEHIYLIRLPLKFPIWKWGLKPKLEVNVSGIPFAYEYFSYGDWWMTVWIDGKMVWEDHKYYERP
jgi:hypothetical protein